MALLSPVTSHFLANSQLLEHEVIERGHINRTYMSVIRKDGETHRYIHQHINKFVFPNPEEMTKNIRRVLDHVNAKNTGRPGLLEIVPNENGLDFHLDEDGEFWRCFKYVENSTSFDIVPNPDIAYKAAHAFGSFLNDLSDLNQDNFHITIPNFHNTLFRLEQLDDALANPAPGRIDLAQAELDFVNQNRQLAGQLMKVIQDHPEAIRIVHNDTKVNNILFNEHTLEAMTVIDLDTVMPGTVLFDIGDLIRTACNNAAEDERDLTKVVFDKDKFAAIIKGFAETTGKSLHPAEWDAMPACGAIITLTIGIRFLTDFINGDKYFQVHRENHNLDRCRTQIELAKQMLAQMPELEAIVATAKAQTV
ncbi:MAG: phosphotransferase enzyme family protein [Fimbriimonadaceae bacterium]